MARATKQTLGKPAPFTKEQVAALTAGKADPDEVAKVLTSHRQPRLALKKGSRKENRAPIPLTQEQLRELASGRETSYDVAAALEKSTPR